MHESDELIRARSRENYRKFAWQLAVVCILVSVYYARMATLGGRPIPFIISLVCAAVFAFIGWALPDRRPPTEEMRDYEEGQHGTVYDGRGSP
jgi:hypothetical protein